MSYSIYTLFRVTTLPLSRWVNLPIVILTFEEVQHAYKSNLKVYTTSIEFVVHKLSYPETLATLINKHQIIALETKDIANKIAAAIAQIEVVPHRQLSSYIQHNLKIQSIRSGSQKIVLHITSSSKLTFNTKSSSTLLICCKCIQFKADNTHCTAAEIKAKEAEIHFF
jgi:hypothetical protein